MSSSMFDHISEIMERKGCELLTKKEEYRSTKTPIRYICCCQTSSPTRMTNRTTVNNIMKKAETKDGLCRSCSYIKKLSIETVRTAFRDKGCELLSSSCRNTKTKLSYRCKNGHVNETTYQTFTHSNICCKRCIQTQQIEEKWPKVKDLMEVQKGHKLISTINDYINRDSSLKYECKHCGEIREVTYATAKHGICGKNKKPWKRCNECTRQKSRIQPDVLEATFKDQGCKLLTPVKDYTCNTQKLKYVCICGSDQHEISYKRLAKGGRCPDCVPGRRAETNLKLYGVENVFSSPEKREKIKKTMMEKFGVLHIMQLKEYVYKAQETNEKRYGHVYKFCSPETKEKGRKTNMERLGVEYPLESPEIREKGQITCERLYGKPYHIMTEHFFEVMMELHGVKYPMQSPEIVAKKLLSGFRTKYYCFPSGRIEGVQGYEPYCIDLLLKEENIPEENIIVGASKVPKIPYSNPRTKSGSYYFPDIYIPSYNEKNKGLIIEVKSEYTYALDLERNQAKFRACRGNGYRFQLYIFDRAKLVTCYELL